MNESTQFKPTHGMTGTSFYSRYCNILARVRGQMAKKDYADRGIISEWGSFDEFKNDMYQDYLEHVRLYGDDNTEIDRIDNNGNYSKSNCRWVTCKQNSLNRRSNVLVTRNGETKTLKGWCEILSTISYKQVWHRINKLGWDIETAITMPKTNRQYTKKI